MSFEPRAQQVSLVHGDYRLGNFLERDGRISVILDWELVHLGDPIEDLGWAFLPQYRGGTSLVCGLADEADFISRYEAQSGLKVAAASLKFYIVFSLMKLAFTNMAAARCFEDGLFNDNGHPGCAGVSSDRQDIGGDLMNNSLPRLIDGMVATLRKEIIPHIDGDSPGARPTA